MSLSLAGKSLFVRALSVGDEGEMQTYSVRVLHFLNGSELCTLEDCGGDQRVAELKLLIEERTGWLPELTVLMHANCEDELLDDRMLMLAQFASEGGLHAELEFYAQLLRKVVVAEKLGMSGRERQVTDALLNGLCDELEAEPVDILDLRGCTQIGRSSSPSCLPQLSMVSVLCVAGCQGIPGSLILACLQGMGGLQVNGCSFVLCLVLVYDSFCLVSA